MKTTRLPLFVAPLLLIVTNAQAQMPSRTESPPWQMYTIKGEDFSVALPTLPAFHTDRMWQNRIQKRRREHSLGSYADGVVYVVHVYENPEPRQSLDSFLKELETPLSSLTDVTLNGFSGKEHRRPEWETMSQFFATKDRLYLFVALGALPDDPRMAKFFSSLSLRKKKDSIEVIEGPGLPYEPVDEPGSDEITKRIYTGREVNRKARLMLRIQPSYTESARQNAIAGTVVLKCVFARNGSVTNIRTASGLPYGLTEKAIEAAQKIKFVPAIKDGKFVSMWMQLEYNFNLY